MTCQVFVRHSCCPKGKLVTFPNEEIQVSILKEHVFQSLEFHDNSLPTNVYVVVNGHKLDDGATIKDGQYAHIHNRLPGGKGGFGSMLRAIGAQIEKTTNREACRDLSGRRLRDIAEEMRLKKWIAKQSEREQEKAARRREKLERRLTAPRHEFRDATYDKQRSEIPEKVNDALMQGLAVEKSSGKRPGPEIKATPKRPKLWLGVNEDAVEEDNSTDEGETSDSSSSSSSNLVEMSEPGPSHEFGSSQDAAAEERTTDKPGCSGEKTEVTAVTPAATMVLSAQLESQSTPSNSSPEDDSKSHIPEDAKPETKIQKTVFEPFDLNKFNSASELESLGLDRLKVELASLGMKCGGTLQQRAERLFSVKGLAMEEIKPSLLAKPKK